MRSRITLATAVLAISVAVTAAAVAAAPDDRRHGPASHEVWTVDQSDTRPDGGGTLYIYADRELREDGASAASASTSARRRATCAWSARARPRCART